MPKYIDIERHSFPTPHNKELNDYMRGWNTCLKSVISQPIADVQPVKHGYWTGRLSIDDACAEGFPSNATPEERVAMWECDAHVTHCSVCGGMFDDRKIKGWKGCPYCLSVMDLERPEDAYFRGWEERN